GFFGRAVLDPAKAQPKTGGQPALALEPPAEGLAGSSLAALNEALRTERRVFRRRTGPMLEWLFRGPAAEEFEVLVARERTELDAYVVLRTVPGRAGFEIHVVDAACPSVEVPRLARSLAALASQRHLPLYITLFGE